jgi:hypothetical protein
VKRGREGQILPLFALVLTAVLGFSALVIDIGFKMSSERKLQSVADAASLAGAQQLQPTSRTSPVTPAMKIAARTQALKLIERDLLAGASSGCDPAPTDGDIVNCSLPAPGSQFRVSVKTPSLRCTDCLPERSVEVIVEEPAHPTTFARLYGQSTWDLWRTSVAGLYFGHAYSIVTLRPPQPLGGSSGFDVRDFRIEGGSHVRVSQGDVGTNANMEYGGTDSRLYLDSGRSMFYFDPYNGPEWTPPTPEDPTGKKLGAMIADPGYTIPAQPGVAGAIAPEGAGTACNAAATTLLTGPGSTYAPYIPPGSGSTPDMGKITCLLPGYYNTNPGQGNNDTLILLTDGSQHGLFYFLAGLTGQSSLIGGYTAGNPGVAVVVPQNQEFNVNTNGGGSAPTALALNAGSKFLNSAGTEATPAHDFSDAPIVTPGSPGVKMTLMVTRDTNCTVIFPYPLSCSDSSNDAIKIAGKSDIYLAGVQFMPTDNSSINSSAATGYIGQIWAWTLKYSGGVLVNQEGTSREGAGVIRIDTACSPGEQQAVECRP